MKIVSEIQVGSFAVNCSIIEVDGKAYIIDPGAEGTRIAAQLQKSGMIPAAILLTHAHFDHIGAIGDLQTRYPDLPVAVSAPEVSVFEHPLNQCPPEYPPVKRPQNIVDALVVPGMRIISTPGHTPGGVCYYFAAEGVVFAGDTLFAGSVGRTDFPGGDMATLLKSLEALKALPPETRVIPGHGHSTTIGAEVKHNPFLQ